MHYFGSWKTGTWQDALAEFQRQAPALYNGQQPDPKPQGMTIKEMVNHFMHHSSLKVKAGELKQRTWNEYQTYGNRIIDVLGADFPLEAVGPRAGEKLFEAMTKCHQSPHSLEGDKAKIMVFFNYANDQDFTERPMKLGSLFRRASRRVKRKRRQETRGHKFFEAQEIRQLLAEAPPRLKAMILLAVNCGFGNEDCATLRCSVVDLEKGWIDFSRAKTGKERRCPLWPETVAALREVYAHRKVPSDSDHSDLVFVTKYANAYNAKSKDGSDNPISQVFTKLTKKLHLHRKGRGFYALRHVTYTIGRRRSALGAQIIMGHLDAERVGEFSNQISDEWYDEAGNTAMDHLLLAVSNFIHDWLFPSNTPAPAVVVGDAANAVAASAIVETPVST
jgi:integrase